MRLAGHDRDHLSAKTITPEGVIVLSFLILSDSDP
jgi:hypothetical protein